MIEGPEHLATSRVVFVRPFTLGSDPEVFPAGIYDVETAQRTLEVPGMTAYLSTSTVLIIPTPTGFRWLNVLASDLDAAVLRDASPGVCPAA